MKIYFCGSIRGGRNDAQVYHDLIKYLKTFGTVLTERIGHLDLVDEREIPPCQIHDRDITWLKSCDVIIAEVTTPSLGVGYELGRAVEMGKPILCLYRKNEDKILSGMISGSHGIVTVVYEGLDEAKRWIESFIKNR
ncbi:MAG: nucleoside 2-deoxyribosyltransferase [Porphyromonadaceae bacterium]|nr:MAG: nucleoside 2-deoxyribosyltransferase [Porphyromonadaceae bacterium]